MLLCFCFPAGALQSAQSSQEPDFRCSERLCFGAATHSWRLTGHAIPLHPGNFCTRARRAAAAAAEWIDAVERTSEQDTKVDRE